MVSQPFQLVMRTGPTPGKIFPISKSEMQIGRESTNDIVINDSEISRKHARILMKENDYILEDFGSTNGTFVAGQRLTGPYILRPGDLILFGENVTVSFEGVQFDAGATVVSAPSIATLSASTPPPPAPAPVPVREVPAPVYQPPAQPVFVGQVPPGPVEVEASLMAPAPKKSSSRTWLLAGCGCLILLFVCIAVSVIAIDYFNLWCSLLGFLPIGCK
jgi:hypothetical protein